MINMKHTCILLLHLTRMSAVCLKRLLRFCQSTLPSIASTSSISPASFCPTFPTPLTTVQCLLCSLGILPYLEYTIPSDPCFVCIRIWFSVSRLRPRDFYTSPPRPWVLTMALLPPPLLAPPTYHSLTHVITIHQLLSSPFTNSCHHHSPALVVTIHQLLSSSFNTATVVIATYF